MTKKMKIIFDGQEISAESNDTIMVAADRAGIYITRLCDVEGLVPQGSCRVCTVKMNGRSVAACTQPVEDNAVIEYNTEEVTSYHKDLIEMLFHEGNHLCPICEASGRCELQAVAYRLGIFEPSKYPYLEPVRPVDASHPDIVIDNNRCILCARCIRASRDVDKKHIFEYVGRGVHKKIGINADFLAETEADINDLAFAIETCPVGCLIRKGEGFFAPIGKRKYDSAPIGANIEAKNSNTNNKTNKS